MFLFLSGALAMGFLVVAGFFYRFWLRTGDRFFILFTAAWLLLAGERFGLAVANAPEEPRAALYILRLGSFLLMLIAIIYKNRTALR